jgi:hypothetical protein
MSLLATCDPCSKSYRVPHANKEWHCKVCKRVLRLEKEEEEDEEAGDDANVCVSCDAENDPEAKYCEECGAPLRDGLPELAPGEKKRAAQLMRTAMKRVKVLRLFFIVGSVGQSLILLLLLALLLAGELDVPSAVIGIAVSGTMLGILIWGLRNLERKPFPITLTLALLQTLNLIISLFTGPLAGAIAPSVGALFYWTATLYGARLARLSKEYPDLYFSKKMRGERNVRAKGDRTQRGKGKRDSSGVGKWIAIGVVVVIIAVVGFLKFGKSLVGRPDDPEPTVEAFALAWNEGDVGALGEMTRADSREKLEQSLRTVQKRYDWGAQLPPVSAYEFDPDAKSRLEVVFDTEVGELPVSFRWEGGAWRWTGMSFTGVKDWRP